MAVRIKEFLVVAMPLIIVTSIVLGLLQYSGAIALFTACIAPFSEAVLGLPSEATTALFFGILRKEMALGSLVILGGTADIGSFMTMAQIYIFAVVGVLFIPCIATLAVLRREIEPDMVLVVAAYTISLGIMVGAVLTSCSPSDSKSEPKLFSPRK